MPVPAGEILTRPALNRALLARQHLLVRADRGVEATIDHLVGMQAQNPLDPYVALWSRLDGFTPDDLAPLVAARRAVRIATLRGTVHLHAAPDALVVRPTLQPVLERVLRSTAFWRATEGIDVDALLAAAREWVVVQPRTGAQLRALVADRHPDHDAPSLSMVIRYLLPLVQVAPRGVWGQTLQPTWTVLDHYVGGPLAVAPSPQELILRYLAAFGPASVQDIATWSRFTGVKQLLEPLRDRVVPFVHEDTGRELFDLPDAPRPAPDVEAPVRFLPEYDNVLLAHADRSRIGQVEVPAHLVADNRGLRFLLVDGMLAGSWKIDRDGGRAHLRIHRLGRWTGAQRRAVIAEGEALLAFAASDEPDQAVTIISV